MKILAVMMISATVFSLKAQTVNDALRLTQPGIVTNPVSLALGNAYTGLSNDYSAVLFNPAGLGLIKYSNFDLGFNYNSLNNNTTFFNDQTKYSNSLSRFNQFGAVFPFPTYRGSFVVALGYNMVNDFNSAVKFHGYNPQSSMIQDLAYYNDDLAYKVGVSYPLYDSQNNWIGDTTIIDGHLTQHGNIISEGSLNNWSFAAALEIEKNIFVGGAFNIYSGNYTSKKDYTESDLANYYSNAVLTDPSEPDTRDFQYFNLNDRINWDISGWSANVGMLVKLDNGLKIGGAVKFPRNFTIKENYSVASLAKFGSESPWTYAPANLKYEYEINTPYEFSLGGSIDLDDLTVNADANFIDYSEMNFSDNSNSQRLSDLNSSIKDIFRSVVNLHGGVEYRILSGTVALRAGFMLLPSAYQGDSSDFDKKFITAGVGFALSPRFFVNAAYAYGWWKDIGDNYDSNVSRTYQDITTGNMIFGIKYTM